MNETGVYDFKLEYTFAGNALAELDRQLALLLSTREGTMPLDREFGLNMDFVDMPPEVAKSLYTAEVTEKVAKFIPTVKVREITWDACERETGDRGLRLVPSNSFGALKAVTQVFFLLCLMVKIM